MRAAAPLLFLLGLTAACPGPDEGENAPTLWLAPDGSEIKVKLAEQEPNPW